MKLTGTKILVLSLALLILAGIVYSILRYVGYLPIQAAGRPVTIGDGSLTVRSKYYWVDSSDNLKDLTPMGSVLVPGDNGWSVEYDYNDNQGPHSVDFSPADNQPLNLTIYYGDDTVSITTDTSHHNLKISSQKYKFKKKLSRRKRYHVNEKDYISKVESCQPATAACTFVPQPKTSVIGISYQ